MSGNKSLVLLTVLAIAVTAIPKKQINPSKVPRARVELHLHLHGAPRVSTVWELAKQKNISSILRIANNYEELETKLRINKQGTLVSFLERFKLFLAAVVDDLIAIERVAYELCEDEANQGVIYFEARYTPQLFISRSALKDGVNGRITAEEVVKAVNRGIKRGEKDFKVKARIILSCDYNYPEECNSIVDLAYRYKRDGVVGIGIAEGEPSNGNPFPHQIVSAFQKAKKLNIHRTVHAGETTNSSANVNFAINEMFAERIGHGYHVVEDTELYRKVKHCMHFEVCPYSSYLTGGVTSNMNNGTHPIVQFAEDNVSFSISKDDPTVVQTTLDEEYEYLTTLGLNEVHFLRANLNAARHSFLPQQEALQLEKDITDIYFARSKTSSCHFTSKSLHFAIKGKKQFQTSSAFKE